ncbi:Pre-mRNA-splicing factor [Ceratocystis lukuohia]|uniref:Pre-mRNA-splicing factor n=1 Tax=Ceratocystis lukuohia TaxID=2019550 RepID=A0ABR4ME74_9PEZI
MAAVKMTKNQMRRAKKKELKKAAITVGKESTAEKQEKTASSQGEPQEDVVSTTAATAAKDSGSTVKPEPIPEMALLIDEAIEIPDVDNNPAFSMFKDIFKKFGADFEQDEVAREANAGNQGEVMYSDDEIPDEEQPLRMSKKKRKMLAQLSIAELKALVKVPEVVEWQDVNSPDPRLLVQIKAQRNVVPVPGHWSLKREYLSSKRGVEKPPFRLPKFIAETGITEMRDAVLEKQDAQSLKQKQRERVQPKMGRLDIDYQKLYDAFFRFQEKPELTRFGEVYYEGKELEVDYHSFRPGELSDETKEALGMPPGAPPPWLINQQRVGPPPSYPTLKIPGLNAPPPPGGSWGFLPGQWGKVPVDEHNRPLYGGDVYGLTDMNGKQLALAAPEAIDRAVWGELQPREEEEDDEDSDEEEDSDDEDENDVASPSGIESPSGYATNAPADYGTGVETSIAGEMDLRKTRRGIETEEHSGPRSAYTVLPEQRVSGAGATGLFGSERTYDLNAARAHPMLGVDDETRKRKKPGDVDVAIDVDALAAGGGLGKDELQRKFAESSAREGIGAQWRGGPGGNDDDIADMIAQESRKRLKVDEERQEKKKTAKYRF